MALNENQSSKKIKLVFRGTDLGITGIIPPSIRTFPHRQNEDEKFSRFYPRDYYSIIKILTKLKIPFDTRIGNYSEIEAEIDLKLDYKLYEFQQNAVDAWLKNHNKQGCVILPTGAGKTLVALEIIRILRLSTLIVVPTLVLIEQWKNRLETFLSLKNSDIIGIFGGGKQQVRPITIITYDSAHLYTQRLRGQFGLIILDEAHHLVGLSYEIIADGYLAPFRLGLTATLQPDEPSFNNLMNKGFGPIIYKKNPEELQEFDVLSEFEIKIIKVKPEDSEDYKDHISILIKYIKSRGLYKFENPFQQIIYRVNQDPEAYKALKAYKKAKEIAFSADSKLIELERLFRTHRNDKTIVFSDSVSFCERIARVFFLPCITHRTPSEERSYILNSYKKIPNSKLVVSKILDEGVDIPDAKIGIILAGSSQSRQFIQRLGRILRRYPEKGTALLYEVISEDTLEEKVSIKRKKDL